MSQYLCNLTFYNSLLTSINEFEHYKLRIYYSIIRVANSVYENKSRFTYFSEPTF